MNKGQSILEVVIALAIFALIASSFISLTLGSFAALDSSSDQLTAATLADEGLEAVRSVRDGAWNELTYNQSAVSSTTGAWRLAGEGTNETIGSFTRTITFTPVGIPVDLYGKDVKSKVDWTTTLGGAASVTREARLTNWDSRDWIQTDWSGGGGQSSWSDATRYNGDDGGIDATTIGELKLQSNTATGGSVNPDFTSGAPDWTFAVWNVGDGEVTPTGSWQSSGGNPGGYVSITIPANARNNTVGGYWRQAVTVAEDGLPIFCSADWRIVNWNVTGNNVDDFRFFIFLDEGPGAPVLGEEVWASPSMAGITGWDSASDVNCSASASVAGTYYFKIAVWLDAPPRRTGPITAGFDNARLAWSQTSYVPSGSLTSSIFDMGDPSPAQIIEWDEQIPVCVPVSACNIKFKIRVADNSAMTGAVWSPDFTASAGTLINPSYNGKQYVQYQVQLNGDGLATPALNEARINYK